MTGHVLVARLDNAGDVVLTGPAVRAIAASSDRVTFLAGPAGSAAAALLPGVDDGWTWEAPWVGFDPPSVNRTATEALVDRIARAGVTFKYTETGPVGLITGKKVYVLAARGGMYQGTPADSQTPYLKTTLGFLGMTDVEFVYAEGLAMGDESKSKALSAADTAISELA